MIGAQRYRGLTASRIAELVTTGALSAVAVVDAAFERLREVDDRLRAFREHWPEEAKAAAAEIDRRAGAGEDLPLAGVPIGVKAWEGTGSLQVRRLVAAGCVPIGATSVPGRSTPWQTWGETDRGPTANPWRADRTPGGSSAGSAAAVAAGIVPLATGTDGAGSTRIPAAWCGVLGIKVTGGALPSKDPAGFTAPGPVTRTAADAARALAVVLDRPVAAADDRLPVATWSATLGYADTDRPVAALARAATERLAGAGALDLIEEPVELLDPEPAWPALRDPAADHAPANALRAENDRRLAELFGRAELLLTPVTPGPPHGHEGPGSRMNTSLTWAFNLSGHPAISIPAGFTEDGCPAGLHVVARHDREDLLLRMAREYERLAPWPMPGDVR